jgi:hypothetical protein
MGIIMCGDMDNESGEIPDGLITRVIVSISFGKICSSGDSRGAGAPCACSCIHAPSWRRRDRVKVSLPKIQEEYAAIYPYVLESGTMY